MPAKRYPLPKRFSAALSEQAYARLRALNERYHYGNNYLLTVLLENLDAIVDGEALDRVRKCDTDPVADENPDRDIGKWYLFTRFQARLMRGDICFPLRAGIVSSGRAVGRRPCAQCSSRS